MRISGQLTGQFFRGASQRQLQIRAREIKLFAKHGAVARSYRATVVQPIAAKRQRFATIKPILPQLRRPQRFAFVTNPKELDPEEVDALWTLAFSGQPQEPARWRTPERWATVLQHSFAVQAVFENPPSSGLVISATSSADQPKRRLVGFARAISDGVFAALVCDVMVHPDFQGQGLGKKMMRALLRHTRRRGPSSFGAFPRPKQRMFFWSTGFRVTSKYRVMRYKLPAEREAALRSNSGQASTGSSSEPFVEQSL